VRIRLWDELWLLNLLVIMLVVSIIFTPSDVLRIIIGLPFVLFFPGYVLMAALFPRREGLGGIERIALSFGISIAVVPLIGLILNYTWWGITLESTLYSIAAFILALSIIAWVRRRRLGEEERFGLEFQLRLPGWAGGAGDKALSVILVIAVAGALGMLGYAIAQPKVGERFTEFYILGVDGEAADYPGELVVGEEGKVVVGIINREYEAVSYRVEVRIDGMKNNEVGPVVLEHEQRWEGEVGFVPTASGENEKVEFWLYQNGEAEPCLEPLYLWLSVNQ
jgi:uncharacterized membrane protein